ncbi:MAG: uroporphyrinogen-III C-methyltransferase [Porphyromonadaceae bacterium]|nr:uroporphyrinogen-III C-methyltransferase [Porphyromonadaceae bacterium]
MGKVYLVGAGPGDAELLTLKASRLIAEAEAVIYDALVGPAILAHLPSTAERIYVGKRAGVHAMTQEEINQTLVEVAQRCEGIVVRLKGGDPFVFGRGGEEMQALREAGLNYEIVPGVTAGVAAPAYCGIPVTHRGVSRSVSLITAFSKDEGVPDLDWEALARLSGTLVFYMSMRVVPVIADRLVASGLSPETPAAIISRGTLPTQQLHTAPIAHFEPGYLDYERYAPGLFVVGNVVDFARGYAWCPTYPLAGRRILVTRSQAQASRLVEILQERGAETMLLPTIEITPSQDWLSPEALAKLSSSTCIFFTSTNGVRYYIEGLQARGRDIRFFGDCTLAAVGPATARELARYGLQADLVPSSDYTARGLIEAWKASSIKERMTHAILPTSPLASGELRDGLANLGLQVAEYHVYDNRPITYTKDELQELLDGELDWITFCSSSAVHNFMALINLHGLQDYATRVPLAAIGAVTAQTIQAYGLRVSAMPAEATLTALADALETPR